MVPIEYTTTMFIGSAGECCSGLIFLVFIIFIIIKLLKDENSKSKYGDQRCPHCGNTIKKWSNQCPSCGFEFNSGGDRFNPHNYDQRYRWDQKSDNDYKTKFEEYKYNVKKKLDRNTRFLRKDKGKCKDCGADLVYREEYHSWYCPNCHSYQ